MNIRIIPACIAVFLFLVTNVSAQTVVRSNDGGLSTIGAKADAACATPPCSVTGWLGQIHADASGPLVGVSGNAQSSSNPMGWVNINQTTPGTTNGVVLNAGSNTVGTVGQLPYPVGSTPYTATATGTTGATTATLTGASSVTTYLCGFSIRANATAAATGNATVTGVVTATLNFTQWTAPNASGLGVTEMIFAPCIPASATNTSIAVVSAAPGTGGVVSVTAWGYKL